MDIVPASPVATDRAVRMRTVFGIVCPAAEAKRLADMGLITKAAAERVSWKAPIAAIVTIDELIAAEATIDEVAESIRFMTATEPKITPERVGVAGVDGYLVLAKGYAAGPAGDR